MLVVAAVGVTIVAASPEIFNYYHIWPGKYPLHIENITAEQLTAGVAIIRKAWKRKLWKTALRITKMGIQNNSFRKTLIAQVFKVVGRKILQEREAAEHHKGNQS